MNTDKNKMYVISSEKNTSFLYIYGDLFVKLFPSVDQHVVETHIPTGFSVSFIFYFAVFTYTTASCVIS